MYDVVIMVEVPATRDSVCGLNKFTSELAADVTAESPQPIFLGSVGEETCLTKAQSKLRPPKVGTAVCAMMSTPLK